MLTECFDMHDVGAQPTLKDADIAVVFGSGASFREPGTFERCRAIYPRATIVGCSTAGEIHGAGVSDNHLVVTAMAFEHTGVKLARVPVASAEDSYDAGLVAARELLAPDLVHVMVFCEGVAINGTALVEGLVAVLPSHVAVTGGLAGDGERMRETWVLANGAPEKGVVAAIGFYGDRLRVGFASMGGWDPFGPERLITRSQGNILYELDGQPAIALYRRYLGTHAAGMPTSGLRFPLALRQEGRDTAVVRTLLGMDEQTGGLVFAGDMPTGHYARLMRANFDRLIDGAFLAASAIEQSVPASAALLISCVGRRLVLRQRVEEEIESVREVLGPGVTVSGFYSYGELCPVGGSNCELHNQTMTITTFAET